MAWDWLLHRSACLSAVSYTHLDIREMAANIIGKDDFLEVFVSTPLEECEKRDVKGLYAKARRGEIQNFTGISAPFEEMCIRDSPYHRPATVRLPNRAYRHFYTVQSPAFYTTFGDHFLLFF